MVKIEWIEWWLSGPGSWGRMGYHYKKKKKREREKDTDYYS